MTQRRTTRLLAVSLSLVAVVLLGSRCGAPDELGPYAVGRTTFSLVDASRDDRTLVVDVWYPAEDDGTLPFSLYDLLVAAIESDVALDEPPVADGSFPLLVFSHGNAGVRFQSIFLQEHLASHGFVVAAPDHAGNTAGDAILPNPPPFTARDRPLDISLVIDEMLDLDDLPGDPFHDRIEDDRIGVFGHSFGGFTTLAMASGFEDVPPDERVSVLMPIAPATGGLTDEMLADVRLPTLVLGGTSDTITPVDPNSVRAFEETSGIPRWRIDVHAAGHNSFTEICLFFDVLVDAGLPAPILAILLGNVEQGCGPDLIPIDEAQRLTNLYATAFFKTLLAGHPGFVKYLTRGYAIANDLPVDYYRVPGRPFGHPHH
ncbi:MAG: alpha/beta hydrolase family protein [Myxococcota bacterium]